VVILHALPDTPLQTTLLRYLLVDLKFVSRLVAAYHQSPVSSSTAAGTTSHKSASSSSVEEELNSSTSASNRSTALDSIILMVASHLRLTVALHPSTSFLFSHLASHSAWRTFQPILIHETTIQAKHPQLPSSQADQASNAIRLLAGLPVPQQQKSRHADGIDIGSQFAVSLGYQQEDQQSLHGGDAAIGPRHQIAVQAPPVNSLLLAARKKKKKLKKKQKKQLMMLKAKAEESNEGETEETEEEEDQTNSGQLEEDSDSQDSRASSTMGGKVADEEKHENEDLQSSPVIAGQH